MRFLGIRKQRNFIALPNGLTFSALDCIYDVTFVSEEYEKNAQEIFVVTKDMALDLENADFIKTIRENYKNDKYYTYVLPDNYKSKEYKEKYKKLYNEYILKFNFIFIPQNTFDLLQEIVIYNPPKIINEKTKIDGFMLIITSNETELYIKLSHTLLREYLKTIYSHKNMEREQIKETLLDYLGRNEIKNNDELREIFLEFYSNPLGLSTKENFDKLIRIITGSNLEKKFVKEAENTFIQYYNTLNKNENRQEQ